MIYAVVGTHDQPFDRLVKAVDALQTTEHRIMQFGHSVHPAHCEAHDFLPFDDMVRLMSEARIIVTHAGVGTVMLALSLGKRPVVVPRLRRYGEHVDDHQLELVDSLEAMELVVPYRPGDDLAARIEQAAAGGPVRPFQPSAVLVQSLIEIIESP